MAIKRPQGVALIAVVLVLAVVLWSQWRPTPAGTGPAPSNLQTPRSSGTAGPPASAVADVKLEDLLAERPAPDENDRNPFRFKPKPPPPPPPAPKVVAQPVMPAGPPVPAGPPPPPPITLKFIGILDAPTQMGRVAILSDKGAVFYGKEGESGVDGRYKIWKIGVESIEISYNDGRGRTTIRLSGS